MKPLSPAPRLVDARSAIDDERNWKCELCDRMLGEHETRWCMYCRMYWDDVAAGMFDDYDRPSSPIASGREG